MTDNSKLFADFPQVSTEEWEKVIEKDLKGADYERRLVWRTMEGINVRPYYRAEDIENLEITGSLPGEFPYIRGSKTEANDWEIRQDIEVIDAEAANKKALEVLNKGVTSLGFIIDKELKADELSALLKDIALDCIEVNFVSCCKEPALVALYIQEVKKRGYDTANMKGSFGVDPLGCLIENGNFCYDNKDVAFEHATEMVNSVKEHLPKYRIIAVNAKHFHNSGASIVQELGYGLAAGVEYMNMLTDRGVEVDRAAKSIKFNFAVGGYYFMEIAKFRAARLLWAKIIEAYKAEYDCSGIMKVHAETSQWNKTIYDPYVNMLRTTTEAMSSVIAGVDSLTVLPFDTTFRKSTDFSERIARNQQILLKEESYLDKIVDPAAGSYYIEKLTDSIVEEAWKLFTNIENKGGYLQAVKNGLVQNDIMSKAAERDMNIAQRKEVLLGTNQFPNFAEKVNESIAIVKEEVNVTCTDCGCRNDNETEVTPLKPYRGAEAFESMRLKTERTGRSVKAFMLTYGNLAMRKARSQFACNFFACAGFDVVDNNGFATIDEGIKAAKDSKAEIVVICSSDEEYAEIAIPIFKQLKEDTIVVLAGYPKDLIVNLREAGMRHFIHVKTNVLDKLQGLQRELNIK